MRIPLMRDVRLRRWMWTGGVVLVALALLVSVPNQGLTTRGKPVWTEREPAPDASTAGGPAPWVEIASDAKSAVVNISTAREVRGPRMAEFTELFADLLERAYVARIEEYGGEPIRYRSGRIEGDRATVHTTIRTKAGTDVPVDYRMHRHGARWLVYDVLIEGISLVANYRTQFNRIIRTSSWEELVERMKAKTTGVAA